MNEPSTEIDRHYLVVDSPYELARWRPLVNWVLFIPHAVVIYGLQVLAQAVFVVYWVMLIVTGKLHPSLYGVMVMYERYNMRATGFLYGYSELYPPFDFDTSAGGNAAYPPVRLALPDVPEPVSRKAALNVLLAIPHYVVLFVYFLGAAVVAIVGWFAVLFTGAWPRGMRDFLVRVSNYSFRVWAYVTMVDNAYPKFGLPER